MEFSAGSAIRLGWEVFKTRPWFFAGTAFLIAVAYLAVGFLSEEMFGDRVPTLVGSLVVLFLSAPVTMSMTAFYLAAHANPETVTLSALWHLRPYWKFVGASLLLWPVTAVWETTSVMSAVFFVPSVAAYVWLMFVTIIVIDQELAPISAVKESVRLVRGHFWPLLGLLVMQALLVGVGVFALLVGILVAVPVVMLSSVHAYRVLSFKTGPSATEDVIG